MTFVAVISTDMRSPVSRWNFTRTRTRKAGGAGSQTGARAQPCMNELLRAAGEHLASDGISDKRHGRVGPNRPYFTNVGIPKSELFQQSPPAFRRCRIYTIAEPLCCSDSNLSLWTFE